MMATKKKSWTEKLADDKGLPRVFEVEGKLRKRWGEGTCVIPRPRDVDAVMKEVKKGRVTTIEEIRKVLAQRHGATMACPITTGIFAWIAAHAAEEARAAGKKRVTPYWRTLKTGGVVNEKYPGGAAGIVKLLRAEGVAVVKKGKKWVAEAAAKPATLA